VKKLGADGGSTWMLPVKLLVLTASSVVPAVTSPSVTPRDFKSTSK